MLGSLNRHEEDLQLAQNRLESRVRERTAELTKARAETELESVEHAMARDEASAAKDRLAMAREASRLIRGGDDVPQARKAIDALAALGPLLEGDLAADLGQALTKLQVAYAEAASP